MMYEVAGFVAVGFAFCEEFVCPVGLGKQHQRAARAGAGASLQCTMPRDHIQCIYVCLPPVLGQCYGSSENRPRGQRGPPGQGGRHAMAAHCG